MQILNEEDKLMLFTTGRKTYMPHQLGIKLMTRWLFSVLLYNYGLSVVDCFYDTIFLKFIIKYEWVELKINSLICIWGIFCIKINHQIKIFQGWSLSNIWMWTNLLLNMLGSSVYSMICQKVCIVHDKIKHNIFGM